MTEQVSRIAHRFSANPWDKILRGDWERFLRPRLEKIGELRLHEAVSNFIDAESFLDQSQFDKHIPEAVVVRKTCPKCCDSYPGLGFVIGKATDKDGIEYECVQSCKHGAE